KAMSADHKVRKTHMERVQNQNMPEEMARLMRDLRARQRDKGVYHLDENNAIRTLKQRLADEWSVISGETIENATSRLDALLDH
ncbi:MAG: hypothetical protein ACK2U4_01970, partial [Candidatus Promineifilaceae bacterium]